jgi:hypothetical protein
MRKRVIAITSACLCALAAFVAAPALSLTPYAPEPVQFRQGLPAAERVAALPGVSALRSQAKAAVVNPGSSAEGGVRWISPPVKAPKTFDAVGIQDPNHEYEYRTKGDREDWSPWVAAEDGNPVWGGQQSWVQVRSRDAKPQGKLFYVNTSGTDSTAHHFLSAARGAIHSAFVSVVPGTPVADASAGKPSMVGRRGWDPNDKCHPRHHASYGKVKAGVVHHTVNTNSYRSGQVKGMVLAICLFHRNSNGWDDIGYNALSDRFGRLYIGRAGGIDKDVIGAQAQGFNTYTSGVASIGDHRTVKMPSVELTAIAKFMAWKLWTLHGKHPNSKVTLTSGGGSLNRWPRGAKVTVWRVTWHSKLGNTECPGTAGRRQVGTIRERAENRI